MEQIKEMEELETERVLAAKQKYGTVYNLTMQITPDDESEEELSYLFCKPKVATYDRFVKTAAQSITKAAKMFALDNVIAEDRERLTADFERYPVLPLNIPDKLLAIMGLGKDVNLTKL